MVSGRTKVEVGGGAVSGVGADCTGDGVSVQDGSHSYGPAAEWSLGEEKSIGGG